MRRTGAGALPADPREFVSQAELATNTYDLDAAMSCYAPDAVLEFISDGAHDRHVGQPAIRQAWAWTLAGLRRRRLQLNKTLISACDATIVNEWRGSLRGHTDARGIEYWRFDAAGRVGEHVLYSFLDVKPSTSLVARLRLLGAYPVFATTLLHEQRRARKAGR